MELLVPAEGDLHADDVTVQLLALHHADRDDRLDCVCCRYATSGSTGTATVPPERVHGHVH